MHETGGTFGEIRTSDGVLLRYREAGSGQPLVLIPGWSQTADQFAFQLAGLADRCRVIAVDMRGHGESDKPGHGYRIARLAKDVHDLLTALDLSDVALLGHSMGASVIWSYYDLFGPERLAKLILVDQVPVGGSDIDWATAIPGEPPVPFAAARVADWPASCAAMLGPGAYERTTAQLRGMVTVRCDPATLAWMVERNLRLPRAYAAALLFNHRAQDWRDVIPRITLPTLVVAGRVSFMPWQSQEWVHRQIPGSQLAIFEEEEGGQHFMFIEGADKFNRIVAEFLG